MGGVGGRMSRCRGTGGAAEVGQGRSRAHGVREGRAGWVGEVGVGESLSHDVHLVASPSASRSRRGRNASASPPAVRRRRSFSGGFGSVHTLRQQAGDRQVEVEPRRYAFPTPYRRSISAIQRPSRPRSPIPIVVPLSPKWTTSTTADGVRIRGPAASPATRSRPEGSPRRQHRARRYRNPPNPAARHRSSTSISRIAVRSYLPPPRGRKRTLRNVRLRKS